MFSNWLIFNLFYASLDFGNWVFPFPVMEPFNMGGTIIYKLSKSFISSEVLFVVVFRDLFYLFTIYLVFFYFAKENVLKDINFNLLYEIELRLYFFKILLEYNLRKKNCPVPFSFRACL